MSADIQTSYNVLLQTIFGRDHYGFQRWKRNICYSAKEAGERRWEQGVDLSIQMSADILTSYTALLQMIFGRDH